MDTLVPTIISSREETEKMSAGVTRLPLRDAVRLCGMSEKTLRRKLEAGLLSGHRETLDYGGFMWMIDVQSLSELYPDSAGLRDYIRQIEVELNQNLAPPQGQRNFGKPCA